MEKSESKILNLLKEINDLENTIKAQQLEAKRLKDGINEMRTQLRLEGWTDGVIDKFLKDNTNGKG